jgi:hypothetical protein
VSSDEEYGERRRRRRRRRSSRRHREDGHDSDQSWDEGRPRRPPTDYRKLAVRGGIALVVAAVLGGGGFALIRYFGPTETQLREWRATPLVGAIIADHPEAEGRLREAIAQEARDPTSSGPTRPLRILAELRQQYIGAAVRRADEDSLFNAMAARAALVIHLQKADPPACRAFSMGGIEHPEELDASGQQLYRAILQAMETAYRKGRAAPVQVLPSLPEVTELLRQAGFTQQDFDRLQNFGSLSNDISCEMELKIDSVPMRLPPDKAAQFARFILGQ